MKDLFSNSNERVRVQVERFGVRASATIRSPYGLWGLAVISFVESALVVPIITDPFMVVYILANRSRALVGVVVTTLASVVGGVAAYFMAFGFFEFVAAHYLTGAYAETFYEITAQFHGETFALTLLGALTPVPYTLAALAVGFLKGSLLAFVVASVIGRGVRYGVVGYLTHRFGEDAVRTARPHLALITAACIALVAAYIIVRLIW